MSIRSLFIATIDQSDRTDGEKKEIETIAGIYTLKQVAEKEAYNAFRRNECLEARVYELPYNLLNTFLPHQLMGKCTPVFSTDPETMDAIRKNKQDVPVKETESIDEDLN